MWRGMVWCWHWDFSHSAVGKVSIFREDRLCLPFGRKRSGPVIATLVLDMNDVSQHRAWYSTKMLLTCAQCCVPHSLSRVRSLRVPLGHTLFSQWYSICSCKGKHLHAAGSKTKFSELFCLKNSGVSLHTPIKDIFLSTINASQGVDA